MRTGVAALIVLMGFVPAASAQDGLRSAVLPERSLTPSPAPRGGYDAGPRTYRPDPRRRPRLPVFGYYGPQVLYPYDQPYVPPVIVVQVPAARVRQEPPPPAPVTPPSPYVAGTPGRPKTFYVIPGCYAGDRRPDPESLTAGCSTTRLRVVEPS
jgi:hypothetical protein